MNRNSGEGLTMLALILAASLWLLPIGWDAAQKYCNAANSRCDTTGLGVWKNMPSATTELMGNTSYRRVYSPPNSGGLPISGYKSYLTVGCVVNSNSNTAQLQLQYAIFNATNGASLEIMTGWQSVGGTIFIGAGSAGTCDLTSGGSGIGVGTDGALNATMGVQPGGYIFRVVGSLGNGQGDNPRFSFLDINIEFGFVNSYSFVATNIGTGSFIPHIVDSIAASSSVTVGFQWAAMNNTATSCVSLSACLRHGSGTCSLTAGSASCSGSTVTFSPAFIGTPNVVGSATTIGASVVRTVTIISILDAQTLTV